MDYEAKNSKEFYYGSMKDFISNSSKRDSENLNVLDYSKKPDKEFWYGLGASKVDAVEEPSKLFNHIKGKEKYDVISVRDNFDKSSIRNLMEISYNSSLKDGGVFCSDYVLKDGDRGFLRDMAYHLSRPMEQIMYMSSEGKEIEDFKSLEEGFEPGKICDSNLVSRVIRGSFFNGKSNKDASVLSELLLEGKYEDILKKTRDLYVGSKKGESSLYSKRTNIFREVKDLKNSPWDLDFAGFSRQAYSIFESGRKNGGIEGDMSSYFKGLHFDFLDVLVDKLKKEFSSENLDSLEFDESLRNLVFSGIVLQSLDSKLLETSERFRYKEDGFTRYVDFNKFRDANFSDYLSWDFSGDSISFGSIGRKNIQDLSEFYKLVANGSGLNLASRDHEGDFSALKENSGSSYEINSLDELDEDTLESIKSELEFLPNKEVHKKFPEVNPRTIGVVSRKKN